MNGWRSSSCIGEFLYKSRWIWMKSRTLLSSSLVFKFIFCSWIDFLSFDGFWDQIFLLVDLGTPWFASRIEVFGVFGKPSFASFPHEILVILCDLGWFFLWRGSSLSQEPLCKFWDRLVMIWMSNLWNHLERAVWPVPDCEICSFSRSLPCFLSLVPRGDLCWFSSSIATPHLI